MVATTLETLLGLKCCSLELSSFSYLCMGENVRFSFIFFNV